MDIERFEPMDPAGEPDKEKEDTPAIPLSERISLAEESFLRDGDKGENKETQEVREKIKGYIEQIEKDPLEVYLSAVEPEGRDKGRSFDAELDLYLQAKERGEEYEVDFSYPHILEEKVDEQALETRVQNLSEIRMRVMEEENKAVRDMILGILSGAEAKARHLMALRAFEKEREEGHEEDLSHPARLRAKEDECAYWATQAFGPLDKSLVDKARISQEERQREPEQEEAPSSLEELLLSNRFDAQEIVYEFNHFFEKAGLDRCIAVIDEKKKNCSTIIRSKKYEGKTVMKVPSSYQINGLKLIQLLTHESNHIMTGEFQYDVLGLGKVKFGPNADAVKEGLAVLREMEISNEVFGTDRLRSKAHPYYVLVMEYIRQESQDGQKTVNPGKAYDYLIKAMYDDFISRGFDDKEIDREARKILRRVFRGVPGRRSYNTKDSIYFKGEEMAKELREAGKLAYVEKSFVDPELIPLFIELGIFDVPQEKERMIAGYKQVLGDIIKQEDWQKAFLEDRRLWQLFGEWEK